MAVTTSGLFVATWLDTLDATQLAVAPLADTIKIALFTDTITPDFTASGDTAYNVSPYDANEVSGTGWAAGGVALGTKTVASPSGDLIAFDAADVNEATTTLTNAECGLIYDDTLGGDNALCLVDFGTAYSTVAASFQITWGTYIFAFNLALA